MTLYEFGLFLALIGAVTFVWACFMGGVDGPGDWL